MQWWRREIFLADARGGVFRLVEVNHAACAAHSDFGSGNLFGDQIVSAGSLKSLV